MGGVVDGGGGSSSSSSSSSSSASSSSLAAAVIGTPLSASAAMGVLRGEIIAIRDDDQTDDDDDRDDRFNYALLIALYTLQGIPMGLSASIPFLIQQKVRGLARTASGESSMGGKSSSSATASTMTTTASELSKIAYSANAIFALCSWPFSLKLLWAPLVDACFSKSFGRRKSWLVPVQLLAGALMMCGSDYVERELGLETTTSAGGITGGVVGGTTTTTTTTMDVRGLTLFFFALYFLMATQDIAVDGWAITMLSRKNRGKGPVCNSIGQNIGYFLSYVGFLALNDVESSENVWRPLLGLASNPGVGLVSLGGFVKCMGAFMLIITVLIGLFKNEVDRSIMKGGANNNNDNDDDDKKKKKKMKNGDNVGNTEMKKLLVPSKTDDDDDADNEIDAYEIGIAETYRRLWSVVKLPAVQSLILILLTYRLPCALSDNVKFLKAVEFGLSKQTTALLSPTIVLPLGILVPIVATKIFTGQPLRQFMWAYKFRVTFVAFIDVLMLLAVRAFLSPTGGGVILGGMGMGTSRLIFWILLIASTALQAIVSSMQFNAQMTFFASRVDPAIGGSYMTLLNTFANLGGTWPSSFIMYIVGQYTIPPVCTTKLDTDTGVVISEVCTGGQDAYFPLQLVLSIMGCCWIYLMGKRVQNVAELPDEAWRTTQIITTSSSSEADDNHDEEEMQQFRKGGKHA